MRPRSQAGRRRAGANGACALEPPRPADRPPPASALLEADQTTEKGIAEQRARVLALRRTAQGRGTRRPQARSPGGRPRPQIRLDHRRRRLGLRHRLRRARPRARLGRQRQGARARHRSLFQHGRPGLQVHAHGRRRQVRRERQGDGEEGPGPDGHAVRPCLRRPHRHSAPRTARPWRRCGRPTPIRGRRSIIAYSHCIAHGFPLHLGAEQQKLAVDTGYWPLFRYDPRLAEKGETAFKLDSAPPKTEPVEVHGERDAVWNPEERRPRPGRRPRGAGPGARQAPLCALPGDGRSGPGFSGFRGPGPLHPGGATSPQAGRARGAGRKTGGKLRNSAPAPIP